MINNYGDFLLENLINENNLIGSDDFINRLKKISDKGNKIANSLYFLFKTEVYINDDLPQNWIDITDANDTIAFTSDAKADKMMNADDADDEETPLMLKNRNSVKIGRFIKALLANKGVQRHLPSKFDEIKDKDIEEFVNLYKALKVDNNKKFKLVKGESIAEWYDEDKYGSENGSLGGSCMKDVKGSYFNIYVRNDKVCRLLIYVNNEKELIGRALVWKLSESPCDAKYFMDRVYVASDSDVNKFKDYAEEQGWLYKYRMNSIEEESLLFVYNGTKVFGKISVQLQDSKFTNYPFVDTLSFLDKSNSIISNVGFKNGFLMGSTCGGIDRCDDCDGSGVIDDEDCNSCDGEGDVTCDQCDGEGTIVVGDKEKTCKRCSGAGIYKCDRCDGEGTLKGDCPECTGLVKRVQNRIKGGWMPDYKKVAK